MSLPEWYNQSIPRVSNIVEFICPFEGTENERRYLDWLHKNNIAPEDYLEASQEMWTEVHKCIEEFIKWNLFTIHNTDISKEVLHWIDFIDWIRYKSGIRTEVYIRDKKNRFQGSCDLLYTDNNWDMVLADWKTWGICKKRWWLNNSFVVNTDKKKKVQIQMSIYAYWLRQDWIKVDKIQLLFLHEKWIKVVDMDILDYNIIENYLELYAEYLKDKDIEILFPNIDNMFEIEILLPVEQYGNIKVRADLNKIDNWKTVKENVDDLITTAKYIRNKCKE